MSNSQVSPSEVNKLISDWASPNDNERRPAEQAIEQLLLVSNGQIDNFVMALCQLLSHPNKTSKDVRIRICILLRKRLAMKCGDADKLPIFCQLHSNTRQQALRVLIKQLSTDPEQEIRNQIADCLTELSTRSFTELSKEYQSVKFIKSIFELYNLSDTNVSGNESLDRLNVTNRINALQIFGHLCQYCSADSVIQQNQKSIAQIYKVAFKQDSNRKVNIAALEAIQLTMTALKIPEILGFIPLMFEVLKLLESTLNNEGQSVSKKKQNDNNYVIDDDDYVQTQYILEIVIQIVCDQPTLFGDHNQPSPLNAFCAAFTQLAVTAALPDKVRSLALEFFLSLLENDPSFARRKPIIAKSVINICLDHFLLRQINDEEWNDLVYEEDEDPNTLCSVGEYALDRCVEALTPEYVMSDIYKKLGIVNDSFVQKEADDKYWNSQNWRYRHCALTVITQVSDHINNGSNEAIMSVNKCLSLFNDSNFRVHFAAINAIGQLSNDHSVMIPQRFSNNVLDKLLKSLSTNNHIKIQCHACAALINFIPSLEQNQIKSQLGALLNGVMTVLKNANEQWTKNGNANYQKAQEQALTAISAISETAGDLFNQHYDLFAPVLMSIVKSATNKEMRDVRCRAIECMGCFGEAVGGNKFGLHAAELMAGTISFFQNCNLSEIGDDAFVKTNICVWPRVLSSIGTDAFYKYLPTICEILANVSKINIVSNKNEEIQNKKDDDNFDYAAYDNEESMAIIETEDGVIALDSQKMENKLAALFTIDSLNENYGAKMAKYAQTLFDVLLDCINCKYSLELRSEAIKLAPRYMDVMIDGIKQNECTSQQLSMLSDKLLNALINVLNEGRTKVSEDSACIGTAAKALLEFINKVDPTDNSDYSSQKSVIRQFLNADKLEFIVDCMFECVLRAQRRIEMFSKQENDQSYDAIAKQEFEEEKEFEDDLLFNIALILAEFIKIYKDDFLSILFKPNTKNMEKLINFLNPQNANIRNPQFVHKTGVYVVCDIYEQCSVSSTAKLLNNFIPCLFNIIANDEDMAVQQACFYCLGLMVNKCKNAVPINFVVQILKLCKECIGKHSSQYMNASICVVDEETLQTEEYDENQTKKRQFFGVIDNAMSAICKILKDIDWTQANGTNGAELNQIRNESLNLWFTHLPIKMDVVEGQICHQYLFKLLQNKNPIVIGQNLSNLPFILKTFSKIANTKLSSKQLDNVVSEFARTICKSQPQFAQNLTMTEKNSLGLQL